MKIPAQSKLRGTLEVLDYLEPEWEQQIIKEMKSKNLINSESVAQMRAIGLALGWLRSKINSDLQPIDNSTPGDLS